MATCKLQSPLKEDAPFIKNTSLSLIWKLYANESINNPLKDQDKHTRDCTGQCIMQSSYSVHSAIYYTIYWPHVGVWK